MISKEKIKQALLGTEREGMKDLVDYMETSGFFTAPGSTKYHGNYEGGLMEHCVNLYMCFKMLCKEYGLEISKESQLICAFGHDLCKVGQYKINGDTISWNPNNPKGHAKLSIERLEKFIKLTDTEKHLIKYHMGMYGSKEFGSYIAEYTLKELTAAWDTFRVTEEKALMNKLSKLFYFSDDIVAQCKDIKK